MRILDFEKGTPEWEEWRRNKLAASEAPIVMECASSYWSVKTIEQLKQKKLGTLDLEVDSYTRRTWAYSHQQEAVARSCILPKQYQPTCVESDDGVFSASLDAYSSNNALVWSEIKCPYKKTSSSLWKHLMKMANQENQGVSPAPAKEIIPDNIWWQMVHQSYVLFGDASQHSELSQFNQGSLIVFADRRNYINLSIDATDFMADWELLVSKWYDFRDLLAVRSR